MESQSDHLTPGLVSVIIVNFNGEDLLLECLQSVHAQSYTHMGANVVDDSSAHESVEMVRREFPAALGEYFGMLNNDTVVKRSWRGELLEMVCHPGITPGSHREPSRLADSTSTACTSVVYPHSW